MKRNWLLRINVLIILALVILPFGLSKASAQEAVELRLAWWGSQARHDATIKVVEMFMAKNPNIKISYEFASFGDYRTKLTTQASGGNLPDVMQQDYAWIAEFQSRNLLLPLDDLVKDGSLNFKDVAEASLKGGVLGGKLYAVNLGTNSQSWILDADCFKKAGLEIPKDDWTWEDFEKTTMTLTEKNGVPGMSRGLSDIQIWKSLYLSLGQWAYSDDGTQMGYTDDQPFVDHLKMILRLQAAKAAVTREMEVANNYQLETDPLVKAQACMTYFWSNQIVGLWKAAGETRNLKMIALPRAKGAKQAANYYKPSMFFSIAANSKHPKEAAMFIDFFTNSIEANQILLAERGVPISSVVRDALKPKMGKAQTEMFDYIARIEKLVSPIPRADPPGEADINTNVWVPQVIDPVLYGQLEPEKGAAALREGVSAILAKNKK
jgi:multiple sugar transport system substrate-binding protein